MIGDDEESEPDDDDIEDEDNEDPDYIPEDLDEEKKPPMEGRRIVDMQFVSNQLLNDYQKISSHRCVTIEN